MSLCNFILDFIFVESAFCFQYYFVASVAFFVMFLQCSAVKRIRGRDPRQAVPQLLVLSPLFQCEKK